jgi:lipid-A-disaccharide synthase
MDVPFVMVYRVSPLTYFLGKSRVKVPHFAMVNLIAGERIVPELVQHDLTVANVTSQVNEILPDGAARDRMLRGLAGVRARLRGHALNHLPAAERAAGSILSLMKNEDADENL